jgi:hypothetical protein
MELHEAGVPGSSYANVHAYFGGKTQPTVEFLQAAAGALAVRPAWLAFGEDEPTAVEQALVKMGGALDEHDKRIATMIREKLGADVSGSVVVAVKSCVMRYAASVDPDGSPGASEAWGAFVGAVAAPLHHLEVDPSTVPPAKYRHYVSTIAEALRFIFDEEANHA